MRVAIAVWRQVAVTTLARLVLAAVLLPYFLSSAAARFIGTSLSMGPSVGGFGLTLRAYSPAGFSP